MDHFFLFFILNLKDVLLETREMLEVPELDISSFYFWFMKFLIENVKNNKLKI